MSKLRVGIVGAGGIPRAHLPRLRERTADAVELTAIADVNLQVAQSTAQEYGIGRAVSDYHEFLPDVDAVLVCVPTHLHADIAIAALRAGKHVFTEKPMTRTIEQADAVVKAVKESGKQLQVGFVRRFDDGWMCWRKEILAGEIGRPVIWRDCADGAGPANAWFNQDAMGGGPFLDGTIHNIDFALYTFGPFESVFCHGGTLRASNTAIDTGSATIRFQSGDELMLAWSWGLPSGCAGVRLFQLIGPKGILLGPPEATPDKTNTSHFTLNKGESKRSIEYQTDSINLGFADQMDEFIEVAQGKATPRAGVAEGYASLQLAVALLESARTGKVVHAG